MKFTSTIDMTDDITARDVICGAKVIFGARLFFVIRSCKYVVSSNDASPTLCQRCHRKGRSVSR